MSDRDNCSSADCPPSNDGLLQQIMPKLGLEAAGPTGRYRSEARTKYLVPRIIAICLLLLLIAVAVFVLLLPARFQDVSLEESPDMARLTFRTDRVMLLESVTATLDGHPIGVTMLDAGSYELEAPRNGQLTVSARTFTGRHNDISMTIDCIDKLPPASALDMLVGDYLYVYLSDGEGKACSGIDWDSLKVAYIDSGESLEDVVVNRLTGYVHFRLPDRSVRIYVEDNCGNPFALRLDRPASGG